MTLRYNPLSKWADSVWPELGPARGVLVHGKAADAAEGKLRHRSGGHGWFRADSLAARDLHAGQCAVIEVADGTDTPVGAGDRVLVELEGVDGDFLMVGIEGRLIVVRGEGAPEEAAVIGRAVLFWRWLAPEVESG